MSEQAQRAREDWQKLPLELRRDVLVFLRSRATSEREEAARYERKEASKAEEPQSRLGVLWRRLSGRPVTYDYEAAAQRSLATAASLSIAARLLEAEEKP